jgi:hypothetical protein
MKRYRSGMILVSRRSTARAGSGGLGVEGLGVERIGVEISELPITPHSLSTAIIWPKAKMVPMA